MRELMRILFAIFRYPAAIVVAFVASIGTIIYLPNAYQMWDLNGDSAFWDFIGFFCTGLMGVAAGSFCLPRNQRWIGSLCLLILGLGFTLCMFGGLSLDDSESSQESFFSPLVPLGIGGSIPILVYSLPRLKSGSNLTEKEVMALVVSEACLAIAIFLLSFLSRIH
jgi:peptidoglycan/LPS O-acetylase OafA/YrhL